MASAWLADMTKLAYVLHIGGGTVGLVAGTIALFARKGGHVHRTAGTIFFLSMLVMATLAGYLAIVIPDYANLLIATFTLYLVVTAWLTVWRKPGRIGLAETIALLVIFCLTAPFALLSFQLATGMPPFVTSTVPFKGPVLVAIYAFALICAIAVIADARMVLARGISGPARIARHLWRMCLGVSLAAGSAFTNGLPRLLPGHVHVGPIFFVPQLVAIAVLFFWMFRVRLTDWYKKTQSHSSINRL